MSVITKPGDLLTYPRLFRCSKCACEFRTLHSEIKTREYTQLYRTGPPPGWKCLILCLCRDTYLIKEEKYVVCPTPKCNNAIRLTTRSDQDKTIGREYEDNCCYYRISD